MTDEDAQVLAAIASLRGPAEPPRWAGPELIRSLGRTRRRRRTALRCAGVMVVAVAVAVPLLVNGDKSPSRPAEATTTQVHVADREGAAVQLVANVSTATAPEPAAMSAVASTEQRFTLDLLRKLQNTTTGNVLLSPSSLATALAMLNYGVRGQTQRQIAALLGPPGSSAQQIASGWSSLVADWSLAAAKAKITLSSANSVWLQNGAPLVASFMTGLADYFHGGVWEADFQNGAAQAANDLDAWVSHQTHGKIPQLLSKEEVQGLLMVLVNAVYFQATWTYPFDDTLNAPFTTSGGAVVQVPTMSGVFRVPVLSSRDVTAVQLPYSDGRFAALVIEPKTTSVADFVTALTAKSLADLVDQLQPADTGVLMPKLSLHSTNDLQTTLQSLGMTDAFTQGADLTGLSPLAAYVAFVKQQATLDVDTAGTTAAAATGIGLNNVSLAVPPLFLRIDHPFLFILRDTKTGAILFSAEINNPLSH